MINAYLRHVLRICARHAVHLAQKSLGATLRISVASDGCNEAVVAANQVTYISSNRFSVGSNAYFGGHALLRCNAVEGYFKFLIKHEAVAWRAGLHTVHYEVGVRCLPHGMVDSKIVHAAASAGNTRITYLEDLRLLTEMHTHLAALNPERHIALVVAHHLRLEVDVRIVDKP